LSIQQLDYSEPLSIYIHVPFCKKRCGYCDFNTFAGKESLIPLYFECLQKELIEIANNYQEKQTITTLFFGGGTPSIVPIKQYEKLFSVLQDHYTFQEYPEISIEANPGSISVGYLTSLRRIGFNRLSVGAQSTDDQELRLLNRIHNKEDIFNIFHNARKADFQNISIDLMFGLPFQEMKHWKKSLTDIISLEPKHISLYALSIELGNPFHTKVLNNNLILPNPDSSAEMYEWAREELGEKGFKHYEISNWAMDGFESLHNKQYWYNNDYIGIGAGAHSQFAGNRYSNVGSLIKYIQCMQQGSDYFKSNRKGFPKSSALLEFKSLNKKDRMLETMMLGLRLTEEGVSSVKFKDRYKEDMRIIFKNEIEDLNNKGLIEWNSESLKLTQHSQFIGNQVFLKFIN